MTDYKGIDYGHGKTNIDHETGIRYGVISLHRLNYDYVYDDFEVDYGEPCCPKCGGGVESCEEPHRDYLCPSCEEAFIAACYPDEPIAQTLNRDGYVAALHSDGDIFITKSLYYTRAQFCSPCAPGACYLTNPCPTGEKAYCFNHDWFEDGVAPYPVYSVLTNELVNPEEK